MPREYITTGGSGITATCRRYLIPFMQGEDYPPYEKGLPRYVRLRNEAVPKKLTTDYTLL